MAQAGFIENTILNPFIFGRSLEQDEPSYGRGDDLAWLEYASMKGKTNQPLTLAGSPGTGKTTLIKRLAHSPELMDISTIIIDTPDMIQAEDREFFWTLSQAITSGLDQNGKAAPDIQKRMLVLRPLHEFKKEFWKPLDESLGEDRILLAFDDFDRVFNLMGSGGQGDDLLDIIMDLYHVSSQVEFLFILNNSIDQIPSRTRYLPDKARIRELRNFDFNHSLDIIRLMHPYRIAGDVSKYIHDLTGGHPSDLQRLCYMLYERCLQLGITHITMADIAVALQMDHAPGDYFMPVFKRRNIYKYRIAQGTLIDQDERG